MRSRNFIKNTVTAVPALGFKSETVESVSHKTSLEVLVMGTSWGFEGGNDLLFSKLKKKPGGGGATRPPKNPPPQKKIFFFTFSFKI